MLDGLPYIIRHNAALAPIAGKAFHSERVTVTLHFQTTGENGMPTSKEDLAEVEQIEEIIVDKLQKAGESILAVVVTGGGTRDVTFMSRDSQGAAARFQELIPQLQSRGGIEFSVEDDPDWSFYRQFEDEREIENSGISSSDSSAP